jgi:hypothetical protein
MDLLMMLQAFAVEFVMRDDAVVMISKKRVLSLDYFLEFECWVSRDWRYFFF